MWRAQYRQKTLITFGLMRQPLVVIQSAFIDAVTARAMTKTGKREETRTTSDSAATRSRKSQSVYVKNPSRLAWKLQSQNVMEENTSVMRTAKRSGQLSTLVKMM
jgi:hypothetical protein